MLIICDKRACGSPGCLGSSYQDAMDLERKLVAAGNSGSIGRRARKLRVWQLGIQELSEEEPESVESCSHMHDR